jgi:hypothetical protein
MSSLSSCRLSKFRRAPRPPEDAQRSTSNKRFVHRIPTHHGFADRQRCRHSAVARISHHGSAGDVASTRCESESCCHPEPTPATPCAHQAYPRASGQCRDLRFHVRNVRLLIADSASTSDETRDDLRTPKTTLVSPESVVRGVAVVQNQTEPPLKFRVPRMTAGLLSP